MCSLISSGWLFQGRGALKNYYYYQYYTHYHVILIYRDNVMLLCKNWRIFTDFISRYIYFTDLSFIHYTKHIAVQQYTFRTNMFYKHTSLSHSLAWPTMLRKLQELLKTVIMPVHRDSTPGLYFKIAYYVKRHFERYKISNILAIFSQTVISNQHDMIDLNTWDKRVYFTCSFGKVPQNITWQRT